MFGDLLELIGQTGAPPGHETSALYATASRGTKRDTRWVLENWVYALAIGEPLPTLPLWLSDDLAVPLELETSYEEPAAAGAIPLETFP